MNLLNLFEWTLGNWCWGQTRSEQMCAKYLELTGHRNVDPQAPHGGPDGGKDIVFETDNGKGIAGCYFPHQVVDPSAIQDKFRKDLAKAKTNEAKVFYFFTGQRISLSQKGALRNGADIPIEIIDVDRLLLYREALQEFWGQQGQGAGNVQADARRRNDVDCLTLVFTNCPFFDLKMATDSAPRRFGSAFTDTDGIAHLIETRRLYFNDPNLLSHVSTWWNSWDAVLNEIRWVFDMDRNGCVYLSREKAESNTDLEEYLLKIRRLVSVFCDAHDTLLQFARDFYPEALSPAPHR